MRISLLALTVWGCSGGALKSTSMAANGDSAENLVDTDSGGVDLMGLSVKEEGPYRVGYSTKQVTYSPGAGFSDRTIRLNIWYPTEAESGESAEYTVGVDKLAFQDAEPASPYFSEGYPVHVHSHQSQLGALPTEEF